MLGLITLACAALSLLQWRWTGEFARAERVRLQAVAAGQTTRMAQAFDETLRSNCMALLPGGGELRQGDAERVHMERYAEWQEQADAVGLFRRIAVAIPGNDGLHLYRIDGGKWRGEDWPADWVYLKEAMTRRSKEVGRPPRVEASGDLIEMPVFGQPGADDPQEQEIEWMIFDVDRGYVQRQLLPGLVERFLNPTGEDVFDAAVIDGKGQEVFGQKHASADARADLFPINVGAAFVRGRGRAGGREARRWTLLTWHRDAGSLDALVTRARWRNLAISLALIAVLGGAAWVLVRYTARTRRLAQLQMEFVAGVSHDLRTPLAAIRGAAYNIHGGLVNQPESLDRYGELILRNAEDLTGMIENLLAFAASKRRTAQASVKLERVEVEGLIRRAAASIEHALEASGGELEIQVAPGTPPVLGDTVALERALRNLLDNAARHGAAGKWIGVTARQEGSSVEIRVQDRGPGIGAEDMPRIFEPFYTGKASLRNHVRGTGLGLSLVRETAEAHGGTVEAENMASGGAGFLLKLPAAPGEPAR